MDEVEYKGEYVVLIVILFFKSKFVMLFDLGVVFGMRGECFGKCLSVE